MPVHRFLRRRYGRDWWEGESDLGRWLLGTKWLLNKPLRGKYAFKQSATQHVIESTAVPHGPECRNFPFWEVNVEAHHYHSNHRKVNHRSHQRHPHRRDCRILSFSAFLSVTGNVPRRAALQAYLARHCLQPRTLTLRHGRNCCAIFDMSVSSLDLH